MIINDKFLMKLKKYQLLTIIIALYAMFMTFYFGLDLLKEGQAARFWITLIVETIVIILAYFALKKRDLYREQRKREMRDL